VLSFAQGLGIPCVACIVFGWKLHLRLLISDYYKVDSLCMVSDILAVSALMLFADRKDIQPEEKFLLQQLQKFSRESCVEPFLMMPR